MLNACDLWNWLPFTCELDYVLAEFKVIVNEFIANHKC